MALQKLIAGYKARTALQPGGKIPALDGLRAFFVFAVLAYHFWQQSWLTPVFSLGPAFISLDPFLRTGYLWVDGLILLSGFLLFLPLARAREHKRPLPGFAGFYRRRFFRIVPSYLVHLLIIFLVVALPGGRYASWWAALRDWLAHLSFTHNLFPFSSVYTPLNGALWTLAVEVQFYLLFPFIARAFLKMPLVSWLSAAAIAFTFRGFAMASPHSVMLVNQLPTFLDVYLNGFVAALVYARFEKLGRDDGLNRVLFSAVFFAAVLGLSALVRRQASVQGMEALRASQLMLRFPQSLLSALLLLGASLGLGGIRLALGNRLTALLAALSYQVYLWHQMVALQLKHWGLPKSVNQNPHMVGERSWQVAYVLLALGLTLLLAAASHYLLERPLQRLGSRKGKT